MDSAGTWNSSQRERSSVSGLKRRTLTVSVIVGASPPGRRRGLFCSAASTRSSMVSATAMVSDMGEGGMRDG